MNSLKNAIQNLKKHGEAYSTGTIAFISFVILMSILLIQYSITSPMFQKVVTKLDRERKISLVKAWAVFIGSKIEKMKSITIGKAWNSDIAKQLKFNKELTEEQKRKWKAGLTANIGMIVDGKGRIIYMANKTYKNVKLPQKLLYQMAKRFSMKKGIFTVYFRIDDSIFYGTVSPICDDFGVPAADGIEVFTENLRMQTQMLKSILDSDVVISFHKLKSFLVLELNLFPSGIFYIGIEPNIKFKDIVFYPVKIMNIAQLVLIVVMLTMSFAGFKMITSILNSIRRDIKIAGTIQRKMIPISFHDEGINIETLFIPAEEVSGDTYNWAVIDDRVNVIFMDIMGHGVPASLISVVAQTVYRQALKELMAPDEILSYMESNLSQMLPKDIIITSVNLTVDLDSRTALISSAGHRGVLLYSSETGLTELINTIDLALMVNDSSERNATARYFKSGDKIVIFSDGITEITTGKNKILGYEGVNAIFQRYIHLPNSEFLKKIKEEILILRSYQKHPDDITVISISF